MLRGKQDETFLVRATDLFGPAHVFNVDIVWVTEIKIHFDTFISYLFLQGEEEDNYPACYKLGDWLQLDDYRERYDSINTLVLHSATTAYPVAVGGQVVQVNLRHPVYASYHH